MKDIYRNSQGINDISTIFLRYTVEKSGSNNFDSTSKILTSYDAKYL